MDLNDKIAARREEMARQQRRAKVNADAQAEAQKAAQQQQRQKHLDELVREKWRPDAKVSREGEELHLAGDELPPIDPEQVKRSALERLLKREVRKAWTPGDNWFVVGAIAAGVALLPVPLLGIPLLILGLWRRSAINKSHRIVLLNRYPNLFDRLQN